MRVSLDGLAFTECALEAVNDSISNGSLSSELCPDQVQPGLLVRQPSPMRPLGVPQILLVQESQFEDFQNKA